LAFPTPAQFSASLYSLSSTSYLCGAQSDRRETTTADQAHCGPSNAFLHTPLWIFSQSAVVGANLPMYPNLSPMLYISSLYFSLLFSTAIDRHPSLVFFWTFVWLEHCEGPNSHAQGKTWYHPTSKPNFLSSTKVIELDAADDQVLEVHLKHTTTRQAEQRNNQIP
jgi:hypothetical protein